MFEFFDVIINLLSVVVDFICNFVAMSISLLIFVFQGVMYIIDVFAYLPPFVMPFVVAVVYWALVMWIFNVLI